MSSATPVQAIQGYDPYAATAQDAERLDKMVKALAAYKGDLRKPLKTTRNGIDDNVRTNRCRPIVDKGASFLFGKPVTFTVEPPDWNDADGDTDADGATDVPALIKAKRLPGKLAKGAKRKPTSAPDDTPTARQQDWLDACLSGQDTPNDIMAFLANAAINAGIFGHAFIKIMPAGPGEKYPRLVNLDPQNVRMISDPNDVDTILAYVVEWQYQDRATGRTVHRRQITERTDRLARFWTITEQQRIEGDPGGNNWGPVPDMPPVNWPHWWSPIQDVKNLPNPNSAWGTPDLETDLIELNNALNFLLSNTNRIIRFHAHPKTWGKGFSPSQMSTSVDGVIVIEDPQGMLANLEMSSDLASSLNFAADVRSDMDELSRVPGVALGRLTDLPKGNLSGVALELLFQPLMEKTGIKRVLWTAVLRQLCAYLLELGGFGQGITIAVNWPQVLPRDPDADAQTAQDKLAVGVSRRSVVTELGYDYDEEQQNREAEALEDAATATLVQNALPAPDPTPAPSGEATGASGGESTDPDNSADAADGRAPKPAQKSPTAPTGLIAAAPHIHPGALRGLNHPHMVARRQPGARPATSSSSGQ